MSCRSAGDALVVAEDLDLVLMEDCNIFAPDFADEVTKLKVALDSCAFSLGVQR